MKKCTVECYEKPTERAEGDVDFVLHTGIYSEKFYNMFGAFYYIYNRDVYAPGMSIDGKLIDHLFISQFNLFNANSCMRCFYGIFVDPSGEFTFNSRYSTTIPMCRANSKKAVREILIEKLEEMENVLKYSLPIYGNVDSTVSVIIEQDNLIFDFNLDVLIELIEKLKEGGDGVAPNNPIITERNAAMQTTYKNIKQKINSMIADMMMHPFNIEARLLGLNSDPEKYFNVAMTVLDDLDHAFSNEIQEFIENVEKMNCFTTSISSIKKNLFRRFLQI